MAENIKYKTVSADRIIKRQKEIPYALISKGKRLNHIALDLFSGHGWGVALSKLGTHEYSVDIMPDVKATRELNGMKDLTYEDVWDYHLSVGLDFNTLIASPPCQSYSASGNGHGRKALNDVIGLIHAKAYEDIDGLRQKGQEMGDERTALVLAPLHYIHHRRPEYIALEQVPSVQPVWDAYAEVLKTWGYHVWTGVLKSEQYGVAQTRKRAILLARKLSPIDMPPPSNSSYNTTDPYRLDPGLPSWVSIQDVLGNVVIEKTGETAKYFKISKQANQAIRAMDTPAPTLAFGNDYMSPRWASSHEDAKAWSFRPSQELSDRLQPFTQVQAGLLQSYPPGFVFSGNKQTQFKQIANSVPPVMAEKILRHLWNLD